MANPHDNANDVLFVVNRLGYGPRVEDYKVWLEQGVDGWLEDQCAAPSEDEALVKKHLDACRLRIKYDASEGKWSAVDEMRPLSTLTTSLDELAKQLFDPQKPVNGQERGRPRSEVIAATMIRSVYSRYQLQEVMAQFWHDHFHVNAFADEHVAVALPVYDRDVIRKNCFGNFRAMLEAVATSTAMQYYLSNHSSRAGAANENYARELFELHSFGRENYLNDHYDRWRDVPGAVDGHPVGYIDQDVYEAARAFTGWTVEDGAAVDNGRKLPITGRFTYVENWHDGYQKRILGVEFEPFGKPMADGRKVLDLIAEHPATAKHMATKLCTRLAGQNPAASLTARVAEAWQKTVHAPNQIAQMVRLIVQSPEFRQSRGSKVKRPLALMASYVRIMGFDFMPSEGLFNQLSGAGQRLFGAPTPVGLPDDNAVFLGSNAMRNRWALLLGLAQNAWGTGVPDPVNTLAAWGGKAEDNRGALAEWFRLFGAASDEKIIDTAMMAAGLLPFSSTVSGNDRQMGIASALAALSPEFQVC